MWFPQPGQIVIGVWVVFATVWLIAARYAGPAARRASFASSLPYRVALILCAFLFLRRPAAFSWLTLRFVPDTPFARWIGATLTPAGIAVAVASRFLLGRNWSSGVTVAKDHDLVVAGPYSVVRHPIYSGVLLALIGTAITVGELRDLIGAAFGAVGLRLKSLKEEQFMEQEFGEQYRDYRRRVKALIPRIW